MNPPAIAASFALLVAAACVAPMQRVPVELDRAPAPVLAPPPAPQVMVAPPAEHQGEQVVVASMSEARRREILLSKANPIEPYVPSPLPTRVRRDEIEYRREYARSSYVPCADPDYGYRPWYDETAELARLATYTTAGAIIGHQFHNRGRGAAIGAGLALLSWPFGGGWWWGRHDW